MAQLGEVILLWWCRQTARRLVNMPAYKDLFRHCYSHGRIKSWQQYMPLQKLIRIISLFWLPRRQESYRTIRQAHDQQQALSCERVGKEVDDLKKVFISFQEK
jgi:hypothetical protein